MPHELDLAEGTPPNDFDDGEIVLLHPQVADLICHFAVCKSKVETKESQQVSEMFVSLRRTYSG